jgi:erythromycin esterase-like protein
MRCLLCHVVATRNGRSGLAAKFLTKRLITEKGFSAVAAEADWPDAYRVNRFVRGLGADSDAVHALKDFQRFPAWMWRNADVLDFIGWLRTHNDALERGEKVGFYGLDLYSLHASMGAVLRYLDSVDPEAAKRARYRYACFEHFGEDAQTYGYATSFGLTPNCESEVVSQLLDMQRERASILRRDGLALEDQQFEAEQNARVVDARHRRSFVDEHRAPTPDACWGSSIDGQLGNGSKTARVTLADVPGGVVGGGLGASVANTPRSQSSTR